MTVFGPVTPVWALFRPPTTAERHNLCPRIAKWGFAQWAPGGRFKVAGGGMPDLAAGAPFGVNGHTGRAADVFGLR